MLFHHLRVTLSELEAAGLVKTIDKGYTVTPALESIQAALHISLTELSARTPDSVIVSPLFGGSVPSVSVPDVFVLMPFADRLRPVYDDHIKKVAEQTGLSVGRANDFFAAESIVADIWRAIFNCRILVADCTDRNPNVFYEIGIAHTVGKRTIIVAQSLDDVPFDLRHLRCIIYEYTPRGMAKFNESLSRTLAIETGKEV